MYDIKQFKPALYFLLMLGITGYAVAAQAPGVWLLAALAIGANGWLVYSGAFRPLPRLVANALTVLALLFMVSQLSARAGTPILIIGQFLVLLHVAKVWEQRANRDYAQLLVLSLLLMVAAAISTASLLFGVMLVVYLFLSLYCCLLFHLKTETDEARSAMALDSLRINPATLRQDQRFLGRSMRRFTVLVAIFSATAAVLVFVLFPRGAGAGMLGQMQWRPSSSLTGFSEQVSFQQVARITQSNEVVANVRVWRDGKPIAGTEPLLLRGVTHEVYSGPGTDAAAGRPHAAWEWYHSPIQQADRFDLAPDESHGLSSGPNSVREEIELNPTGTPALFSTAGPISVSLQQSPAGRRMALQYMPADQVLESLEPIPGALHYTITASGSLGRAIGRYDPLRRPAAAVRQFLSGEDPWTSETEKSVIDPQIASYARRAEVSGGGLADARGKNRDGRPVAVDPLDEQIARNIEHHLQSQFSYTLDLTDSARIAGRDPMVAFLYDFKRGHCEYFAGAMTLMCQSLGMTARMVVGFKCDEYNSFGQGFYVVRQSHAHAWVEVLTADGWKTFDPTSGHEANPQQASAMLKVRHFFQFLEHTWATSVIAYDNDNRENLIQNMENKITSSGIGGSSALNGARAVLDQLGDVVASNIIGPLLVLLVLALVGAIGWFAWERWRFYRRAKRIGLESLPSAAQYRLVRQLGFYDDLLRLLERHQIHRPTNLTPMEFSHSLSYLPSEIYDTVHRLTQLFYRIRYGGAELDSGQQRRLTNVIERLSPVMLVEGKRRTTS